MLVPCAAILALALSVDASGSFGMFPSSSAYAEEQQTVYSEGYFYYHSYEGFVSICGYFGSDETVTIPSFIAAKPVSRIEAGAFSGRESVRTVVLPETIMEVQAGAFADMPSLVAVKDFQTNDIEGLQEPGSSYSEGVVIADGASASSSSGSTDSSTVAGKATGSDRAGESGFDESDDAQKAEGETQSSRSQVNALTADDASNVPGSSSSEATSFAPVEENPNHIVIGVAACAAVAAIGVALYCLYVKGRRRHS